MFIMSATNFFWSDTWSVFLEMCLLCCVVFKLGGWVSIDTVNVSVQRHFLLTLYSVTWRALYRVVSVESRFKNSLIGMFSFRSPNSRPSYIKLSLSVCLCHTHTHTHRVCLCFFVFCIDQPHVWEEVWNGAEVAVPLKWEGGPGFGPWWGYRPYSHVGAPSPWARAAGIS